MSASVASLKHTIHHSTSDATDDVVPAAQRCRVCNHPMEGLDGDDVPRRICGYCLKQPAGKRLLAMEAARATGTSAGVGSRQPPPFTAAEKSLIKRLRSLMPAQQLLDILNDRLQPDRADESRLHTLAQLQGEIGSHAAGVGTFDWAGMKKLLAKASRDGVLGRITDQLIDDFAVVWSLNSKQVVALKDIVLGAQEEPQ
ncbi:hypothetical protein [Burkholderia vietnamiensis]|uniref:hypothetical protein n=1 Tax=Burkholderia vietnamiensis TaxID=60552 RepID=UPI000B0424F9|nr:hypothetical protein [Burkholderia vietnamiensis]HDR9174284.1 hypothetical protein [Burkholderia vietnamiensis]